MVRLFCPLFPGGQEGAVGDSATVHLIRPHFSHLAWEVLNFAGHLCMKRRERVVLQLNSSFKGTVWSFHVAETLGRTSSN